MNAPGEFRNEPLTDFSDSENVDRFRHALGEVEKKLSRTCSLWIGGRERGADETFASRNPARPSEIVAVFPRADAATAGDAVEAAHRAFPAWSGKSFTERADVLFRAAAIMRRCRAELAAWMVLEVGKPWPEADADAAEAIDFLDYYGREAIRLERGGRVTPLAGEKNEMIYIPLGVGAIIPPWNFPLAILAGMTSAALVCGNTLALKPSSDAPAIGWRFAEIMREAGLPDGVLNFVTGGGEVAGEALVRHPLTRFVSFTGSKAAGLRINAIAAEARPGQKWIKRVTLEMGGKDAILVDADADLDAAARAIVDSAFGFSGQKCSACSRAVIVDRVHDEVLERVRKGAAARSVGDPRDFATAVGPVINRSARDKILGYLERGRQEGRLVAGGEAPAGDGYFIRPTVFADVSPSAAIAREEIFGPVLAVIRARDFDHGLAIVNDTDYGLTGSVYTRSEEKIDRARREFHVGNLYINRKCTGAMVGAHPFGGFNMSGTDSKAGGPDYLLLFTQAKAISRKL